MNRILSTAAPAAVRYSAISLIGAALAVAQQAPKAPEQLDAEGKPVVIEKFEVTGSRVKRLDYETPSPIVTYTAQTMDAKGYDTPGEFMQSLPFNNSTANSEFTTASFVTGAATINPRGLGSNRVLTLIDGRRTVPYALTNSASGTPQSVFNFNSVPAAAIDRIEFLKDGASAIYGSDAITGVFNIILKKNYTGTTVDLSLSNTLGHDSLNRRLGILTGFAAKGWNISFAGNVQSRHSNYLVDFGVPTTDFRYLGPKGTNFNNVINHPSFLQLNAATAVATGLGTASGYYLINNPGTANPTKASFHYGGTASANFPNENRYNLAPVTQIYPDSESYGGYVNINRILTPAISVFSRFGYFRSDTHYVLSPYLYTSTLVGLTIPATNPYNPLGIPIANTATSTMWSFASAPPKREVSSVAETALVGLKGTVNKIWNWESALNYGQNNTIRDTDLISASTLQAALSGTTRATAYNPFGPSDDPDLERKLFTRSRGLDGKTKSLTYDLGVTGSFYQLPFEGAGEIGVATGYEHRYEHLSSNPEPNNFLGFTATTPYDGSRNVDAGYAEITLPVKKWLEFQVAGRHERFSDFGKATKGKYAGKVRLPANRFVNVLVRASYSQSYKAPDLGQLYAPISRATSTATYLDPLRPQDAARQLSTRVGGNPSLQPEEAVVKYAGFVFDFPAIKGLDFSADYFDQQVDNVIGSLTPGYLLSRDGLRKFPNAIIRDNSRENPGPISYVDSVTNNLGMQLYRGWDFALHYGVPRTRFGSFNLNVDVVNVMKRGSDNGQGAGFGDATGYYFAPEFRYNYGVNWRYKNWGASVSADVIGKYFNDSRTNEWGENPYTIVSPTITYRGFKKTTISIGSNNVFDNRPPPNGYVQLGFDDRTYANGVLGRTVSLRVRREF